MVYLKPHGVDPNIWFIVVNDVRLGKIEHVVIRSGFFGTGDIFKQYFEVTTLWTVHSNSPQPYGKKCDSLDEARAWARKHVNDVASLIRDLKIESDVL